METSAPPTTTARSRTHAALLLATAGLLIAACAWWLRAPLHPMPLERDEGAYAVIAREWLRGSVLYRDLFDHKPPLTFAVFALAPALADDPVVAVRRLATLYLLASGLALAALGRRLYGRWIGLAAFALWVGYGSSLRFQGLTFNTEAVMALPALLGCLCAAKGMCGGRGVWFCLAGICVGLAALAKPVGAALLLPLLLGPLLAADAAGARLRGMAPALGGAALPLLLFTGYLWRAGALPAAWEALVAYNRLYAAESAAGGWDPRGLWPVWQPMLALLLPGAAGLAASMLRPAGRTPEHAITALWGGALLVTAIASLRGYPHYYLAAVPFFCLWAAAGAALAAEALARAGRGWLTAPVALLLLGTLLAPPLREVLPLRPLAPGGQIAALYGPDGEQFFGPAREAAAAIAQLAPPGEPIFVWAAEPELYLLADRRPATRFVYDYPVDRLPGARQEVLDRLRRVPPPLIVTYRDVRPIGFHPFMSDLGYRLDRTIAGYDLFVRALRSETHEPAARRLRARHGDTAKERPVRSQRSGGA